MPAPPEVTPASGGRGQWQPHQATVRLLGVALLILSLLVWWRGMPGLHDDTPDTPGCPAPVSAQVADWGTSSTLVVQARFDGLVTLSDGATQAQGWRVMVRSTSPAAGAGLAGTDTDAGTDSGTDAGAAAAPAAGSTVLIWPGPAEGAPRTGEGLQLWVRPHEGTTVDDQPAPGFDAAGVLAVTGRSGQRLCGAARSRAVPLAQLAASPDLPSSS